MIKFSPYLKTLLDPKYIGDGRPEIIFNGIDGETLQTIIDYCYNDGYTDITVRNALQVMEVASNLEMHQLEKCCSKMNYHYIWWYAMDPDKSRKSIRHICSNFENVPIAEIVNIDEMYFRKILQETKIVAAESIIFDRLMKWVQHKETKRSACMAKLAPLIRLQHLPYEVNLFNFLVDCAFMTYLLLPKKFFYSFCATLFVHFMTSMAVSNWYSMSLTYDHLI